MAKVVLKDFDDKLLADADYYALEVRHSTRTQFFESAVRRCVEQLDSRAPEGARVIQQAGRDAKNITNHTNISAFNDWKFLSDIAVALHLDKLIEIPENFMKGGWGWLFAGFFAAFVFLWLVGILSL